MSNDSNAPSAHRPGQPGAAPTPAEQAAEAVEAAMAGPEAADCAPAAPDASAQVAALAAELEQAKSRLDLALRNIAELDNIRKRTEREKDDVAKYAISKFARDMLAIGDNLQRAIAALPPAALGGDPALASFHEGVLLTERELLKAFERNGMKRLEPRGEPFNPHRHQAVLELDGGPGVVPGTVVEVFQPGYVIEDRVLRPAMVGVAKGSAARSGGPAPGPAQAPPAANDPDPRSA